MSTFRIPIDKDIGTIKNYFNINELMFVHCKRIVYELESPKSIVILNEYEDWNWLVSIKYSESDDNFQSECTINNLELVKQLLQLWNFIEKSKQEYQFVTISSDNQIEIQIKKRPLLPLFLELKSQHIMSIKDTIIRIGLIYENWYIGTLWEYYSKQIWVPSEYINNLPNINFTTNILLPDGLTLSS